MISPQEAKPAGASVFLDAFAGGLRPEPELTVLEWADTHRVIAGEAASEPGPYRSDRTPYMREIMEALSASSPVREVALVFAAQVGKTEVGCNLIGYAVDVSPGPILVVQPTVELAERFSEQRLASMIEATPRLRAKVSPSRSRDDSNRKLRKKFPGGVIVLAGANSAASLRSMPVRWLYLDEEDAYPQGVQGEGDPIELAKARARTFGVRAKTLRTSTPTIEGISRIASVYAESDRRVYEVPCPECDAFQVLKFPNLKWDNGDPETVRYACEACGVLIGEEHKGRMLARGCWTATATSSDPGLRGYHLSGLYSPPGWLTWAEIVRLFLKSKDNPERLRTFTNTVLAETWKEKGEVPEWERLYHRRESYKQGTIPRRGLFLTAGVDVQRDRLEIEVKAWGRGLENWSVDYLVLEGDTSTAAPWTQLAERMSATYAHETGANLPIRRVAIDTGFASAEVAKFVRKYPSARWMPVKGDARPPMILGTAKVADVNTKGKRMRRGIKVWPVGVNHAKAELYGWLRLPQPLGPDEPYPPGFPHYPADYDETYFRQLCSEELVHVRTRQGFHKPEWRKLPNRTNPGGRNEVLDCNVYARAAAAGEGVDRWSPADWTALEEGLGLDSVGAAAHPVRKGAAATATKAADKAPTGAANPPPRRKRDGGGFMDRWRKG